VTSNTSPAEFQSQVEVERRCGIEYLIEAHPLCETAAVAQSVRTRLGGGWEVEPLFDSVRWRRHRRLGAFYLARLPNFRFVDLPHSPYEWAYELVREPTVRSAEPNNTVSGRVPLGLPARLPDRQTGAGVGVGVAYLGADRTLAPDTSSPPYAALSFLEGPLPPPTDGPDTGVRHLPAGGDPRAAFRCARDHLTSATPSALARALVHATEARYGVVAVTAGSLSRRAVREAAAYAVDHDAIVIAAGEGTNPGLAPGIYDSCIVAGRRVSGSDDARQGRMSTDAVVELAESAARWLSSLHERGDTLAKYAGIATHQAVFLDVLTRTRGATPSQDCHAEVLDGLPLGASVSQDLPDPSGAFEVLTREEGPFELVVAAAGPDVAGRLLRAASATVGFASVEAAIPHAAEILDLFCQVTLGSPHGAPADDTADALLALARVAGSTKLKQALFD
jgi:hypothetical protein